MSDSDQIILEFLTGLAMIESMFRKALIAAQANRALDNFQLEISILKTPVVTDFADHGVTYLISLEADVRPYPNQEIYYFGMSLEIRRSCGLWHAEIDYGYPESYGWKTIDNKEETAPSIEELMNKIPSLIESIKTGYFDEIAKFSMNSD